VSTDRASELIELVESACSSAQAQYDDMYKGFVGLDGKAQAAGAVAGVLAGFVTSVVNASQFAAFLAGGEWRYGLLALPAIFAVGTVVVSIWAMRVQKTIMPYATDGQMREVQALIELPPTDLSADRLLRYHQGRLKQIHDAIADIRGHIERKGKRVLAAQALLIATLLALVALFFAIVGATQPPATVPVVRTPPAPMAAPM
jgi:hypothetical protein